MDMVTPKIKFQKDPSMGGSLALKKNNFLKIFSTLLNLFLIPLACYWFINDNAILASSQLLFLFSFNICVYYSLQHKEFPIPYALVVLTLGLTLLLTVYYVGYQALFWTYPVLVAIYFVVPIIQANICSVIIVLPISILLFYGYDLNLALRYTASITATLVLGNAIVKTITDLQHQLLKHSITDPLTGAFNRRQMDVVLNHQVQQNTKSSDASSILMLDIDFFKKINDEHGHEAGDAVLQDLVSNLLSKLRKSDQVFRIGGEEFLILLLDTDIIQAEIVAEDLRKTLAKINVINSDKTITASFGVAKLAKDMTKKQWLKTADFRLYQAKRLGRNKVIAA